MSTLQEIKKSRGLTNKSIGQALGVSASVAGMILQGRHINVYRDEQIAKLAQVLGITFERCWMAMQESYNEWRGTPGREHERTDEVRARVQDSLGLSVWEQPRPLATVEGCLVVPSARRLEEG